MKFQFNNKEFYIDGYLANQLHSIAYNLPNDWDIVLIITGDRSVRVGKSVLAMTVCAYLAYILNKIKPTVIRKERKGVPVTFKADDIYFDNQVMIEAAQKKPKFSINLYDEGREGLAASKAMKQIQQDLIDFFTECGQLNQIFVVVAPDFFELKEYMAVGRAEVLINVYRKEIKVERDIFNDGEKHPIVKFQRGHFEFFSRNTKRNLYDRARSTRRKNYGLIKADFIGSFVNQYTIDEELYRKKKEEALKRFDEKHKEEVEDKNTRLLDEYIHTKKSEGYNSPEIALLIEQELKKAITADGVRKNKGWIRGIIPRPAIVRDIPSKTELEERKRPITSINLLKGPPLSV